MKDVDGVWVALESSNRQAGLAILSQGKVHLKELEEGQTQSADLIPVLKETLEALNIEPSSVTDLALNVGPGSATGLRMGVALAQGWSLVYPELRVHAVTLEACSQMAFSRWLDDHAEATKGVLLSDAFGGEVFLQELERDGPVWKLVGKMDRHPRGVIENLDGSCYVIEDLGGWKEKVTWPDGLCLYEEKFPVANHVLEAALGGDYLMDIEQVDVRYLKPSSAELLWEKRNQ